MNTMPSQIYLGAKSLKMPHPINISEGKIRSLVKVMCPRGAVIPLDSKVSSVLLSDSFPSVRGNYSLREKAGNPSICVTKSVALETVSSLEYHKKLHN